MKSEKSEKSILNPFFMPDAIHAKYVICLTPEGDTLVMEGGHLQEGRARVTHYTPEEKGTVITIDEAKKFITTKCPIVGIRPAGNSAQQFEKIHRWYARLKPIVADYSDWLGKPIIERTVTGEFQKDLFLNFKEEMNELKNAVPKFNTLNDTVFNQIQQTVYLQAYTHAMKKARSLATRLSGPEAATNPHKNQDAELMKKYLVAAEKCANEIGSEQLGELAKEKAILFQQTGIQ